MQVAKNLLSYGRLLWNLGQHGNNHTRLRWAHRAGLATAAASAAINHYEIPVSNIDPATVLAFCLLVLPVATVANLVMFVKETDQAREKIIDLVAKALNYLPSAKEKKVSVEGMEELINKITEKDVKAQMEELYQEGNLAELKNILRDIETFYPDLTKIGLTKDEIDEVYGNLVDATEK